MLSSSTLINNSFTKGKEIIMAYIYCYKSLDDQEKEIKRINPENELYSNTETRLLNMDSVFYMQLLELKTIVDAKESVLQQLICYIYSLFVLEQSQPFYDTLIRMMDGTPESDQITELSEDIQAGGGILSLTTILNSFMFLIMMQSTLGLNTEITGFNPSQNIGVSMNINSKVTQNKEGLGKSLKVLGDFTIQDIDIKNETQMEDFVNQYRAGVKNFKESTNIQSENLPDLYEKTFLKDQKKELNKKPDLTQITTLVSMVGAALMVNQPKEEETFDSVMNEKVIELNKIGRNITISLKEICNSFPTLSTDSLPLEYFRVFNEKMVEKGDLTHRKLIEQKSEIEKEATEEVKLDMTFFEEEPSQPTAYQRVTDLIFPQSDEPASIQKYDAFQDELDKKGH